MDIPHVEEHKEDGEDYQQGHADEGKNVTGSHWLELTTPIESLAIQHWHHEEFEISLHEESNQAVPIEEIS